MKKFALAVSATLASTGAALANFTGETPTTAVPEISALEGTAAIAALAAIVLLTWERRRRAH